jgi:hypothetical protein
MSAERLLALDAANAATRATEDALTVYELEQSQRMAECSWPISGDHLARAR